MKVGDVRNILTIFIDNALLEIAGVRRPVSDGECAISIACRSYPWSDPTWDVSRRRISGPWFGQGFWCGFITSFSPPIAQLIHPT